MATIRAVYRVRGRPDEAERTARFIALEQTVEVPETLVGPAQRVGEVVSIVPLRGASEITIDYDASLASGQLPQLLNLVYGNVSMRPGTRLADLVLPEELVARFPGPRFGVEGVRALLGVFGRPLLCTALKPRGAHDAEFASIAREFALGGGDVLKDDHNLVDADAGAFRRRLRVVRDAIAEANAATGRFCLYLPHVGAPVDRLEEYLDAVILLGLRGVLVPSLLLGLDTVRALAQRHRLVVMAHPSFTGAFYVDRRHGIEPGLLLGTIARLAGVDASILAHRGGRFPATARDCASIARRLREPLGSLRPSLPVPGGGVRLEHLPDLARRYGRDAVILIAGALLGLGPDLRGETARFVDRIRLRFGETLAPPQP